MAILLMRVIRYLPESVQTKPPDYCDICGKQAQKNKVGIYAHKCEVAGEMLYWFDD